LSVERANNNNDVVTPCLFGSPLNWFSDRFCSGTVTVLDRGSKAGFADEHKMFRRRFTVADLVVLRLWFWFEFDRRRLLYIVERPDA